MYPSIWQKSYDHKLFSWRFWNKKNKILIRKILCFSVKESFSVVHPEGWVLLGIKFPNSFYHTNNMSFLWSIGPSARQETSVYGVPTGCNVVGVCQLLFYHSKSSGNGEVLQNWQGLIGTTTVKKYASIIWHCEN